MSGVGKSRGPAERGRPSTRGGVDNQPKTGSHVGEATVRLGARLRETRSRRRETLAVVAERAGLTAGFLSKLETGQTEVSIGALLNLCQALEVELAELTDGPSGHLVRAKELQPVGYGGEGLRDYLLTPLAERRIQVQLGDVLPGGGSGDEQYELPVEVEFVHVLEGCLTVTLGEEEHVLSAGDSLTFSRTPHKFNNPADTIARVIWAFAPALPSPGERPTDTARAGAPRAKAPRRQEARESRKENGK